MHSYVVLNVCLLSVLVGHSASFLVHHSVAGKTLDVQLDLQHPVSHVGLHFLGVTMDSNLFIYGNLSRLDINSPKLQAVTQALSPGYLRVGGTSADTLIFNPSIKGRRNHEFGPDVWDKLNAFARVAKLDLIWDFNHAGMYKNGHWDPSNARALLQYSQQKGYPIPCFQLGNEPTLYSYFYHVNVSPQSLAHDFPTFKSVVHSYPHYSKSCILGPEVTNLTNPQHKEYLSQFLQAGGAKALSGITLHHYYRCAPDHPVNQNYFFDLSNFEFLERQLQSATAIAKQYAPGVPLWFSETSTLIINCPGDPHLRTTYLNGFLWLDKLGLSTRYQFQHVIRHQFFSQLVVGTSDFTPLTDYYLTLLYKRLVQGPVLKVLTSTPTVRVYANCANPQKYQKGAIVIYAINIQSSAVTLTFSQFHGQQLDLYMLTPGDHTGLSSKFIALNGKKLTMNGNELPPMPPKTVNGAHSVTLQARSYGFVVIPHANVQPCKH